MTVVPHLSYLEALVVGAFQGFSELFPISSLGHSVLVPALVGGRWATDLNVSAHESPYLAFIVGLHVATAAALLIFFWRDWLRIIGGFFTSVAHRRIETAHERLAWLLIIATIPVGLAGLVLEHLFRTTLGRPVPAAAFLVANGVVLLAGERLRRRAPQPASGEGALTMGEVAAAARHSGVGATATKAGGPGGQAGPAGGLLEDTAIGTPSDERLARLSVLGATAIGAAQILALLPGLSRSGSTMVAGLVKGLSHEDAARFSFLLATPVILAAGALKIPDLFGPLGAGIHGQVLVGSLASFVTAYLSVRYLTRYFRTRTLTPFAIYSIVLGAGSLIWLTLH